MKGWVDFRAIKQAVSLEAVMRHWGVKGLRRRGDQLEGRCPIHQGERGDSFRANLARNIFHCFACQASGNVLDFVAAIENCSIREAALLLQHWFGTPETAEPAGAIPQPTAAGVMKRKLVREEEDRNPPLRFTLTAVDHDHPYLQKRGIDRLTAIKFGVGFYAGSGLMNGRIVIPIHNEVGGLVAYAGRAPDGRPPKYKLPTGLRKSRELFNLHRAIAAQKEAVIVVEGYFDCMRVHQAGFASVIGLMGVSLSAAQERTLVRRFRRAILMLDGDAAGREASRRISTRLSQNCSVFEVDVPDNAQPDQLPDATIKRLLTKAIRKSSGLFETGE